MFDALIRGSLANRSLVLIAALALAAVGLDRASRLAVDVFPDLNRPTVTVMTEAPGLAPEEVEALVTFPIESALNGASDVLRVRSASGVGLSIVYVEFAWGADVYRARQVVAEKIQLVRARLPDRAEPVLTPISSIMGEIALIGLKAGDATDPMALRTLADWTVRPRLLGLGGVAQVTVMGGVQKQYQVLTTPERLARHDVTLDELTRAVAGSNSVAGGGFLLEPERESLIRILGRATDTDSVAATVIRAGDTVPVTVGQVADVRLGGPVKRGEGSVDAGPAVILSVQKQPGADTLALTRAIDRALEELAPALPPDVEVDAGLFRQQRFIDAAVANVAEAVRDGALWVVVVLGLVLWDLRVSVVTLLTLPLSVLATALAFGGLGVSINTMTLGGLAVAIGELVDDAIVDVENIGRRLRENRARPDPLPALEVVFRASAEVRNSIVYATLIVVLVVLPLFALPGLEGRLFAPLGLAYLVTLLASLLVALTVTPALASIVLPRGGALRRGDPPPLRLLKRLDAAVLRLALRHADAVLLAVALLVAVSVASLAWMGGEFLPEFREGTLTIAATCPPGTSLAESDRIGRRVEAMLGEIPEVTRVSRRTGRAELDEHAENVNVSEIDVGLVDPGRPRQGALAALLRAIPGLGRLGMEPNGRPRAVVLADVRDTLSEVPGVVFNVGQPISHRLDHILTGIRAQLAVKLYGPDLDVLRARAAAIARAMGSVPGVVDLQVEPQVAIPQLQVRIRRDEAARYGLAPAAVAEALETALQGRVVGRVLEGQRPVDLVVWFDEPARGDDEAIRSALLRTPSGARVALGSLAEVERTTGPNTIHREGVLRRLVVQANTAGRDLASVVADVRRAVDAEALPGLPPGYFVEYGGQFEARREANRRLLALGAASVLGVLVLLRKAVGSWALALQVMANVPLAAAGSVVALLLAHWPGLDAFRGVPWWGWPRAWAGSVTLSLAHWVGFITMIGIVARNGILMISHYLHLMEREGEPFGEAMIVRGSLERLAPVLMTALTTVFGLAPLAFGPVQPGKEILQPLAVVVLGGVIGSTLLDQVVTPALFYRFGRPRAGRGEP